MSYSTQLYYKYLPQKDYSENIQVLNYGCSRFPPLILDDYDQRENQIL